MPYNYNTLTGPASISFDSHRGALAQSKYIMADTRKHVLIAGLGKFVPKDYEMGAKLGQQKTNKQLVMDVSIAFPPCIRLAESNALKGYRESSCSGL
jgi:hypothetical protein